MGSFVFKWEHPASEVYVTGTFDSWSKSEKLDKKGDVFTKDVTLSSATEKIYYKFVVDGNWVTDHTAPQENDASGNLNNVLTTDRIIKHTPATAGIMSGVAPTSTTAELAKNVPLEKAAPEHEASPAAGENDIVSVSPLPAFPGAVNPIKLAPGEKVPDPSSLTSNTITSSVHDDPELVAADEKNAEPTFSVAPLPAFDGAVNPIELAPGEKVPDPSSLTSNTIASGAHDDPELVAADKGESEPTFGVAPLPAFAGAVNPVRVAPGDKIPDSSTLTSATINSTVRTDKESYENSGGLGNAPSLPFISTQSERDQNGTAVQDLPPISKNLIPESSLPMGDAGVGSLDAGPTIQSAGPQSTTAQLAADVPLESSKVPEVVKESQKEAGVDPEASAVPEEVKEKSAVEKELLSEVPVAPPTSEGTAKDTPDTVKDSAAESGLRPPTQAAGNTSESRDVSPGTVPGSHSQTQTGPTATAPATPAKDPAGAATTPAKSATSTPTDKKKKRTSFFGKLKAKFGDKNKD